MIENIKVKQDDAVLEIIFAPDKKNALTNACIALQPRLFTAPRRTKRFASRFSVRRVKGLHENDFIMASKIDRIRSLNGARHQICVLMPRCDSAPFGVPPQDRH